MRKRHCSVVLGIANAILCCAPLLLHLPVRAEPAGPSAEPQMRAVIR